MSSEAKPLCTIENWYLGVSPIFLFLAPEDKNLRMFGDVSGHPSFEDGQEILTTRVVSKTGSVVTTASGTKYLIGEPAPEYEKRFPGSKERFLKALPET